MIQNLNQFKKACIVGTKVEVVLNAIKPELQGTKREIIKAQTNALQMLLEDGRKTWLDIPKARECVIKDDVLFITDSLISKSNQGYISRLTEDIESSETSEENRNKLKERLNKVYEEIESEKTQLIKNGAEFLDENNYIWFGIKIA